MRIEFRKLKHCDAYKRYVKHKWTGMMTRVYPAYMNKEPARIRRFSLFGYELLITL